MSQPKPRSLYEESRVKLCERIGNNIQMTGSFCRQIMKSSKTNDILANTHKSLATMDSQIAISELNLKKTESAMHNMDQQLNNIQCLIEQISDKI